MIGILVTADPHLTQAKATGLILGLATWRYFVLVIENRRRLSGGFAIFSLFGLGMVFVGMLSADWHFRVAFVQKFIGFLPPRLVNLPEAPAAGVHTNNLAGILTLFVPLSLAALVAWRPRYGKKAALLCVSLLFIFVTGLLMATQSRSGWMGAGAGLMALAILWIWIALPSHRRGILLFMLVCLSGMAIAGWFWVGPERIQALWEEPPRATVIGNLSSLNFRKEVWQWALDGIRDFPFTGTGLGTFREVVLRFYPINLPPAYDIGHVHNVFLQVALDVGLPGLVAYLAILGIAVVIGWQVALEDKALRPFSLGLLCGLIGLHVYGLMDAQVLGARPNVLFWMALGLLTAMRRLIQLEQQEAHQLAKE